MTKTDKGRYHLQVFDTNARRMSGHQCDGTYDAINDLIRASQNAITDEAVSSVLIRDTENLSHAATPSRSR